MPEPGGPTTQSGILFQNRAAALWLGRLLDPRERQRTLLLIDGMEPLQNPPPADPGCIKDLALGTLLRELAAQNPGLCVVSTRLPLADLESWRGKTVDERELAQTWQVFESYQVSMEERSCPCED
jgi:hypothetical protein